MQARFLLGPAGSGKTFRCLAEIRAALAPAPASPRPLILLAPKQATFQLERQLLATPALAGFSRLQVLSFDRLAAFVSETLRLPPPRLLSAEGRLMVLRALLRQHEADLQLLRASVRRPGFAQELAGQLAEFQQHQIGPARLRSLALAEALRPELRLKLRDLALLLDKYTDWLLDHNLQDAHCLLDVATDRLRAELNARRSPFLIDALWLDGFAEMTPQEHALLAAVVPFCQKATLAFCLETEPAPPTSWLSIWSAIGKTFQRCRQQLAALPDCQVQIETLSRIPGKNRFADNSALGALESGWSLPNRAQLEFPNLAAELSVTACPTPEAEAVLAARELLKFVRGHPQRRFRDCAVLVRNLENYHQPLARVFRRYGIPFFLDRRENVAHHPLAELTRGALRTLAFGWQHDDWFATLKAGFTPLPETDLDRLENLALEFGWHGSIWRNPLPDDAAEALRQRLIPPFEKLDRALGPQPAPAGAQLAQAIRGLWADLRVESALAEWALPETDDAATSSSLHQTVFEQMRSWLDNVALAFPRERLPLRDWLQVLDAGLAALTVGVIPPALDEVLVGAIDRARNPNLKFALLLGLNESVFPAPPVAPVLLTNSDRDELDRQNIALGPNVLDQISRERYLGYIACTRAGEKLAVTFAHQDPAGRALNPSPLITQLECAFPQLAIAEFSGLPDWPAAEHVVELFGALKPDEGSPQLPESDALPAPVAAVCDRRGGVLVPPSSGVPGGPQLPKSDVLPPPVAAVYDRRAEAPAPPSLSLRASLLEIPAVQAFAEKLARLREPDEAENLSPALAEKLYGPILKSSVSRLEEFAQCPFRFFVQIGLRVQERKAFELDARERGTFQHEILKKFHDDLAAEQKRWRDLTPAEARARIGAIAADLAPAYRQGLLRADPQSRFAARAMTLALQDFVETLVTWMRGQYEFDPARAEVGFGLDDPRLPAWNIPLAGGHQLALRGRIDRIDLFPAGDHTLAVVMDYKSGVRKLDPVLIQHGIQLQLLAYLAALRRWPPAFLGADQIVPAGVFYVNLRGQFESGDSRAEVLAEPEAARRLAYRHSGRFNAAFLPHLDRPAARDQFNYQLNSDGRIRSNSTEALAGPDFVALLDLVEAQLRQLGGRIFSGVAAVDPYRKGTATACDYCDFRAICRIDGWAHEFRELRAADKKESPPPT